jgi:hypothetical protein
MKLNESVQKEMSISTAILCHATQVLAKYFVHFL